MLMRKSTIVLAEEKSEDDAILPPEMYSDYIDRKSVALSANGTLDADVSSSLPEWLYMGTENKLVLAAIKVPFQVNAIGATAAAEAAAAAASSEEENALVLQKQAQEQAPGAGAAQFLLNEINRATKKNRFRYLMDEKDDLQQARASSSGSSRRGGVLLQTSLNTQETDNPPPPHLTEKKKEEKGTKGASSSRAGTIRAGTGAILLSTGHAGVSLLKMANEMLEKSPIELAKVPSATQLVSTDPAALKDAVDDAH